MPPSEEKKTSLVIGDVVQLNSGGGTMTVHEVSDNGIKCAWRDRGKVHFETFQIQELTLTTHGSLQINIHLEDEDPKEPSAAAKSLPR